MLSAKQVNYLVPFLCLWYDAVLDWGLNPGPPALKASTIPLGYQGGGVLDMDIVSMVKVIGIHAVG